MPAAHHSVFTRADIDATAQICRSSGSGMENHLQTDHVMLINASRKVYWFIQQVGSGQSNAGDLCSHMRANHAEKQLSSCLWQP